MKSTRKWIWIGVVLLAVMGCRGSQKQRITAAIENVRDETRGETRELVFDLLLSNPAPQPRQVHVFLYASSSTQAGGSALWPERASEQNLTPEGELHITQPEAGHAVTVPAKGETRIANKSLLLPPGGPAYNKYRILVYNVGGALLADDTITASKK